MSPFGDAGPSPAIKYARWFALTLLLVDSGICFAWSYKAESGWTQAGIQFFVAPALGLLAGVLTSLSLLFAGGRHGASTQRRLGHAAMALAWGVGTALVTALLAAAAAAFAAQLNPQSGC